MTGPTGDIGALIAWLRVQLDEDEREACDLGGLAWTAEGDLVTADPITAGRYALVIAEGVRSAVAEWAARHDPAAVLADIAAKRAILDAFEASAQWEPHPGRPCDHFGDPYGECVLHVEAARRRPPVIDAIVVRMLATAYAGRAGYREEWRTAS